MNRLQALAEKLPQEAQGALITSSVNRDYLTGLKTSSGILLVTRDENYLLVDFRYIEVARNTVRDCQVILQDKVEEQLKDLTKKHDIHTLALEVGYQTIGELNRFRKMLPKVEFLTDSRVHDAIRQLRSIKDEREVAAIRAAQKVTDAAFLSILDFIRPGRTEREIAAELEYRMKLDGAENPAFDTICVAGPNSSLPHGVPGDRSVQTGDFLTMDFGAMVDHYCSDMTRTVAIGPISEEMREVYKLVLDAQLAAIKKIAPGVPCKEVDAAARDMIYGAGYEGCFGHGLGHSLGLEIHEDPRFSHLVKENTLCQPGLVMSVEPGVYLPGRFGCRIEDIVLITDDGCDVITGSPKELIVL